MLDEIEQITRLAEQAGAALQCRTLCVVDSGGVRYPVQVLSLCSWSPEHAAVGFFGGVHGLQHIGAQWVLAERVLAGLRSIVTRLQWEATLHHLLGQRHRVTMPVVNPGGMARGTRANPQSVDHLQPADRASAAAHAAPPPGLA